MKKVISILAFFIAFAYTKAQVVVTRSSINNTVEDVRHMARLNEFLPRYIDTTAANLQKGIDSCGAIIFTYTGNKLWKRSCNPKHWEEVGGGISGNLGTGYRSYVPSLLGIKTSFGGLYINIDSSSNINGLTFKVDTTTMFPVIRATVPILTANNGITKNVNTFQLGSESALSQYTPIHLNGFPLSIVHNGVNNANQSDSNSLRLVNNTTATSISDSLVTPSIQFYAKSKPIIGSSQGVGFRIFERGHTGSTTGGGQLVISSNVNNGAYTPLFRMSNTGAIQDNLLLFVHQIGNAGAGTNSIRFGASALNYANNSSVTGGNNIAIGNMSMASTTSGGQNVAVGSNTLQVSITGTDNVAIGQSALALNTANFNTAVGSFALSVNSSGQQNTAVGKNALALNTTSQKNVAIGAGAMEETTTGGFNTSVGQDVMLHNTIGASNVAIGWLALATMTAGNSNVAIGYNAGTTPTGGDNNIWIGVQSGTNASQTATPSNSIAIGASTFTTASNQMVLGNSSITQTKIFGIASAAGPKVVIYDPATNIVTYVDTASIGNGGGGGTSDHTDLSNLGWTASGHTGTASNIAGFNGSGAASLYTLTGTGTVLATSTSPTFVTPTLGTPSSGTMTNTTGYLINNIAAAVGTNTINNGNFEQEWQWNTLAGINGMKFTSTSTAASGDAATLLYMSLSGINSGSGETTYGIRLQNTHTGTSAENVGALLTASGAGNTSNAAIIAQASNGTTAIGGQFSAASATNNIAVYIPASGGVLSVGSATPTASVLNLVIPTTTANTTASGVYEAMNSLTSGTGHYIASSSMSASGKLLHLVVTTNGSSAEDLKALFIQLSGSNGGSSETSYGQRISNVRTGTNAVNVGIETSSSGGNLNRGAMFNATGTAGENDGIIVTASGGTINHAIHVSSGSINIQPLTAQTIMGLDANKNMVSAALSGLTFDGVTLAVTGGVVPWNGISNATGDQALTFDAGESSTWTNSNTTEDLFTVNSSTVTTSSLFSLNRTSTVLAAGNNIIELISSGANASSSITSTVLSISGTNTGTTSTNVGINVISSGATNNYAILATGRVGIGTSTPNAMLDAQTTSVTALNVGGGLTPSAGSNGFITNFGGGITEAGSSTHTILAGVAVFTPIITGAGASVTNATGLYVSGDANASGADNSAIWAVGTIRAGQAGSVPGIFKVDGSSSGQVTLKAAAAAGTPTLTYPTVSGVFVQYAENTISTSSTPTPTGDARENFLDITALAVNPTFGAPTGTPANHNMIMIRLKDNGGGRTLAWNSIYRGGVDIALPTATSVGLTMYLQFSYNSADDKWDLVGKTDGI